MANWVFLISEEDKEDSRKGGKQESVMGHREDKNLEERECREPLLSLALLLATIIHTQQRLPCDTCCISTVSLGFQIAVTISVVPYK